MAHNVRRYNLTASYQYKPYVNGGTQLNCPKCQKKLPKGNPKICPNCKKDLSNYYRLLEKQGSIELQQNAKAPKNLPRILLIAALACCVIAGVVILLLTLDGKKEEKPVAVDMEAVKAEINSLQVSDFETSEAETDYVLLTVKDFGQIVVRLRPDVAPISAQNFKELVARHYYDGTTFHRVYPGFMIQGGAGAEALTPIKGEFSSNGVENNLLHIRGVLSMARTTVKDSATSQFFLMQADNDTLDGNYAAFGYIVAGLETVDNVCTVSLGINPDSGEQSVPLFDVVLESAVFVTPNK